jgi:hypothetical protein
VQFVRLSTWKLRGTAAARMRVGVLQHMGASTPAVRIDGQLGHSSAEAISDRPGICWPVLSADKILTAPSRSRGSGRNSPTRRAADESQSLLTSARASKQHSVEESEHTKLSLSTADGLRPDRSITRQCSFNSREGGSRRRNKSSGIVAICIWTGSIAFHAYVVLELWTINCEKFGR